jgi:hypothetical protein
MAGFLFTKPCRHSQTPPFPLQLIFHGAEGDKMLYIFDLGNVIVDIDFNRVLGTWSDLTPHPAGDAEAAFHHGRGVPPA